MPDNGIDSDGSDWFEKDEDEILQDLVQKGNAALRTKDEEAQLTTEYIRGAEAVAVASEAATEDPNLDAAAATKAYNPKISISDLRQISQLSPLDAFLGAATHEPDLIAAPVNSRDGQNRVLLYARILSRICSLELPGFHEDYLRTFAHNDAFAEHVLYLVERLFSQRYKSLWTEGEHVDQIVGDIRTLLLQAHQASLLSPKWLEALREIKRRVVESDAPAVAERKACLEFRQHLEYMLPDCDDAKVAQVDNEETENCDVQLPETAEESVEEQEKPSVELTPDEFYPTLNEFQAAIKAGSNNQLAAQSLKNPKRAVYESVSEYVATQKQLLREDFMIPLRICVRYLNASDKGSLPKPKRSLYMEDVRIELNRNFLTAQNHGMVFVNLLGGRIRRRRHSSSSSSEETESNNATAAVEEDVQRQLSKIKTGALLCFTTSCNFENLILATVTYTDKACLSESYLGIEIVRQYNIGNFYGQPLIMFETPAFFEPYQNVYNFLNTCSIANFPMKQYIIGGETSIAPPGYFKANTDYKLNNGKKCVLFKPQPAASLPPGLFQLNDSQRAAFSNALTQEFCLIQGPPGTGKTHLSVHLMKTLIDNAVGTQKPLVLITYTNESLDKFLMKLTMHTNSITRFGCFSRHGELATYNIREAIGEEPTNPHLKRLFYITNLAFKAEFEQMQQLIKNFDGTDDSYQQILAGQPALRAVARRLHTIRLLFNYYVVREKHVIAMTTTCAAKNNFLFRLLKSPIVVFEEAAEILESHIVACLTPHTQHVIMIGDHRQLQPYTATARFCVSLFERLIKRKLDSSILDVQYRMHPAISSLICPMFYKTLHNAEGVVDKYPPVRKMRKNLYFLTHTQLESKSEQGSKISIFEIEQIRTLAAYLILKAKYKPKDMVILSPYKAQIELIRKELKRHAALQYIRAMTVDSFQGTESDIVLLTLVRSNGDNKIGFLNKMNRICVALSRAKHALYMIGNMELMANCNSKWRSLSRNLQAQGAIGRKFPYENEEEVEYKSDETGNMKEQKEAISNDENEEDEEDE